MLRNWDEARCCRRGLPEGSVYRPLCTVRQQLQALSRGSIKITRTSALIYEIESSTSLALRVRACGVVPGRVRHAATAVQRLRGATYMASGAPAPPSRSSVATQTASMSHASLNTAATSEACAKTSAMAVFEKRPSVERAQDELTAMQTQQPGQVATKFAESDGLKGWRAKIRTSDEAGWDGLRSGTMAVPRG